MIDADYKATPGRQGVSEASWEVRLIDVATHRPIGQPLELWGQIGQVSFSPDSATVITADFSERFNGRDGMIRTWDAANGNLLEEAKMPETKGVIVNPEFRRADGKRIRMGNGGDNILVFTDVATHKVTGLIQSPGGTGPTAISPDGALLVTAGGRAQQLWDLAAHKPIGAPLDPVADVAFSPDSQTILTGSKDGNARLRPLAPAVEGKVEQIVLWAEVLTGSVLNRNYPARGILRPQELLSRQNQLEKLGGWPLP
jgi:WD40 repeat protein